MIHAESLGLPEAERAIAAAMAMARRYGRLMAFAVADNRGELIACARMDGTHARVLRHAIRKAYTSAVMERNTLSFKKDLEQRVGNLDEWGDVNLTTLQGGQVVKSADLTMTLGAVGAGGAASEIDDEVARVMVRAAGFEPTVDERFVLPWIALPASVASKNRTVVRLPLADHWLAIGQEPIAATVIDNFVHTSGVPGIDMKTGLLPEDPERQFELAFVNLQRLLEAAGVAGPQSIALVNVYIPNGTFRPYINKPWLKLFPGPLRPGRKTNQASLPAGMAVQLQAVAMIGNERQPIEIPGLAHRDPLPMGSRIGPMAFSSVIGGQDPATGQNVDGPLPQIDCAFDNMRLFMEQAGGSLDGINHVWVFMKDFKYQPAMVDTWVRMFPKDGDRPSRKTLPYELGPDTHIQVQLTGVLQGKRRNFELPGVGHHDPIPMGSAVGNILHSSGLHGIDPKTGKTVDGLDEQTEKTLDIVQGLMNQAGGKLDDVALITVILKDLAMAPVVMARLRRLFPDAARTPALKFVNYNLPNNLLVQFHLAAVLAR